MTCDLRFANHLHLDLSAVLVMSFHQFCKRSIPAGPERFNRATCIGQALVLTHLEFGVESLDR